MASILDSGLASIFTGIFTFLLVYAIVFGVLSWRKIFGEKGTGLQSITALFIALLAAIAPPMRDFISFITPWYVALALVIFLVLFIISMFGLSPEKDFPGIIRDSRVYAWIMIFVVLIFVMGLGFTLGPGLLGGGDDAAPAQPVVPPGMEVIGGQQVPYAEPGTIAPGAYPSGGYYPQGVQAGQPGSTATSDFGTNMVNTIFHPKVLGLMVTFLIAAVAVFFLSNPTSKTGGGDHGGSHH